MSNPPIKQQITDTLEKNYMPYAMSVMISSVNLAAINPFAGTNDVLLQS